MTARVRMGFRGVVLGTVLAGLLFSSCGPAPTDTRQPILTVFQASVTIGDPHIVSDALDRRSIIASIYEALVGRDEGGDYQPALAERW